MKDSTPQEAFGRAVTDGFLMTLAFFAPFMFRSVPFTFICDSISFIAAYAMVRETWHAQPRALLIFWLLAYSSFNLFVGWISGYGNMGPMTERRLPAFEMLWINQSFEFFGGAILFVSSIVLWIRALSQWKKPLYL